MKRPKTKTSTTSSNRKLLLVAALVALLAVGGIVYYTVIKKDPVKPAGNTSSAPGTKKVNLDGPTKADKAETQQHKNDLAKDGTTAPPKPQTADGRIAVQPTIAYMDKTTINAFVTGVFEDDGTCTATLTQGTQTIIRTSAGFKNASYTQCTPINLSDTSLGISPWSVVVSYSSGTASGNSQATTLKP